jgi:hypothetical protein
MIQENVAETERGTVGGVQNSLNQLFELIKYSCVIVMPEINKYGYLVTISMITVFISFIFYSIFYFSTLCNSVYSDKFSNNKNDNIETQVNTDSQCLDYGKPQELAKTGLFQMKSTTSNEDKNSDDIVYL